MEEKPNLSRSHYLPQYSLLAAVTLIVAAVFFGYSVGVYNYRITRTGAKTFTQAAHITREQLDHYLDYEWALLSSMKTMLEHSGKNTEDNLISILANERDLWNLQEILIRTESGQYFNSRGKNYIMMEAPGTEPTPGNRSVHTGSDLIFLSQPVERGCMMRGEAVVEVSLADSISLISERINQQTLLDSNIWLTDSNGNLFARTFSRPDETEREISLLSYIERHFSQKTSGSESDASTAFMKAEHWTGLIKVNGETRYIHFEPLDIADKRLFIVTEINERIVNAENYNFSRHIVQLSFIIILLSLVTALLAFLRFHKQNRKYVTNVLEINRRANYEQLQQALVLAQQASAAKSAFLSQMSHDIRTPMNAIVNMTNFAIKEIDDTQKVQEYLDVIKTSSDHLLRLINDVLDMSRIESGKLVLKEEPFNLTQLIDNVSSIISSECEKKRITFSNRTVTLTHPYLKGDALRLRQVLINLLNNGVKYTPENGTVILSMDEFDQTQEKRSGFRFTITDTGCGIPKEKLNEIFEPFTRLEGTGKTTEGSGLGLAISKSIVDTMNGVITVQSILDAGSIFTVTLYFDICSEDEAKQVEENRGETGTASKDVAFGGKRSGRAATDTVTIRDYGGRKVLVAEDLQINQQILGNLLKSVNLVCDFAGNGQEAVDMFEKSGENHYSLIFMDIQMPVLNGYEATKAIRAGTHPQAKGIPIVAMTANVFDEDIEKCRQAGMDAHTGKPLDPEQLFKTIDAFIGTEAPPPPTSKFRH